MTMDQKKLRLQTSMRMLKDEPVPEGYMRYRSVSSRLSWNCSVRMLKDEPVPEGYMRYRSVSYRLSCEIVTAHRACSRTSPSLRYMRYRSLSSFLFVISSLLTANAQGRACKILVDFS
jgi:hypothetical protein